MPHASPLSTLFAQVGFGFGFEFRFVKLSNDEINLFRKIYLKLGKKIQSNNPKEKCNSFAPPLKCMLLHTEIMLKAARKRHNFSSKRNTILGKGVTIWMVMAVWKTQF